MVTHSKFTTDLVLQMNGNEMPIDIKECVGDCSNDGLTSFTEGSSTEEVTYGPSTESYDRTTVISANQITTMTTNMTTTETLSNILNDPNRNSTEKDKAFRDFLEHVGLGPVESNRTTNTSLDLSEIDNFLEKINGTVDSSFNNVNIWAYPLDASIDNLLGVVVKPSDGRANVTANTKNKTLNSSITVGAIVDDHSVQQIKHMAVIFIKNMSYLNNLVLGSNMTIASSIAIVDLKPKIQPSFVRLFFQSFLDKSRHNDGEYRCAFLNHTTSFWDNSGCKTSEYDSRWDRFECVCDHQTPFSIIWVPKFINKSSAENQSIASMVFLLVSILSFLVVLIHSIVDRNTNSINSLPASDLLPLLSVGNTMVVFVIFIISTQVAHLRKQTSNTTVCSSGSFILSIILYFFVLLMFCTKTSVGYFNYLRFVRLFPEPSLRTMTVMLFCSFAISSLAVCSAIVVHLYSSAKVFLLQQEKTCWFNQNLLHYFLTIPITIFLIINTILLILVIRNIVKHVRNASSAIHLKKRRAKCITVLLFSAITQGIGWFFGPASTVGPQSMQVICSWIFDVCNALEGFWTIILYFLIRSQKLHISKLVRARQALFQNKQKAIRD